MKPFLKQITEEELRGWLSERGEPAFRLRQIRDWLFRSWSTSFADMRNVPAAVRRELGACFSAFSLRCVNVLRAEDGTEKLLFELSDGEFVEAVSIPTPKRVTVCVSTQVGCPVRCCFCVSGSDGLVRNLVNEILAQAEFPGAIREPFAQLLLEPLRHPYHARKTSIRGDELARDNVLL